MRILFGRDETVEFQLPGTKADGPRFTARALTKRRRIEMHGHFDKSAALDKDGKVEEAWAAMVDAVRVAIVGWSGVTGEDGQPMSITAEAGKWQDVFDDDDLYSLIAQARKAVELSVEARKNSSSPSGSNGALSAATAQQ